MTININYSTILALKVRKYQLLNLYYLNFAKFLKFTLRNSLLPVKVVSDLADKNAYNIMKNFDEWSKIKKEINQELGE